MTTIQQHGISRSTPGPKAPRVSGQKDVDALQKDVQALRKAVDDLIGRLNRMEDKLVRRVNEVILSGTLAQRPAAGVGDRLYFSTDQAVGARLRFDDGTAWQAP